MTDTPHPPHVIDGAALHEATEAAFSAENGDCRFEQDDAESMGRCLLDLYLLRTTGASSVEKQEVDVLFPLLWRINDALRLTPDGDVEFTGSQNDVEDFRAALHRFDPRFIRGTDPSLPSAEEVLAQVDADLAAGKLS